MDAATANIVDRIIEREGGFVNDPRDSGGATRYGVTEAVARAHGYRGVMQALPLAVARDIYAERYIERPGFGPIIERSEAVAAEVIDTGVLAGPRRAGEFLQTALVALNTASSGDDIKVDGNVGPRTMAALDYALRHRRAEAELVAMLNAELGAFLVGLAQRRPKDRAFLVGWFRKRVMAPA